MRPLVGGKCSDDARLRRSFLGGTDATQLQADAPCAWQQCRGHNHLGRSPEKHGHIGQAAATGRRHACQHCTVRSAPRPLNNVLPPSTPDVKRSLQPYARNATSGRRHSLNLSGTWPASNDAPHARRRPATRPAATVHAAAHRRRTLHNAKTTRHPPQPAAPLPGRLPPPLALIIWSCEVMRA